MRPRRPKPFPAVIFVLMLSRQERFWCGANWSLDFFDAQLYRNRAEAREVKRGLRGMWKGIRVIGVSLSGIGTYS